MSAPTIAEPTPAERVRTIAAVPHAAVLAADGYEPITVALHHVLGDRLVVAVPDDVPWLEGVRAMVEINDISPLPLRERTRSLVWLSGRLSEVADGAALAARIAQASPLVVGIGKEAFYHQAAMSTPDAYAYAREVMADNATRADAQEGMDAFVSKRTPTWTGR